VKEGGGSGEENVVGTKDGGGGLAEGARAQQEPMMPPAGTSHQLWTRMKQKESVSGRSSEQ
jgi:hypothetical protein